MEDPKAAKGLVKRDVIRVITAGTVIESSMLDETRNNYLACCCLCFDAMGLCFVDVSTGELHLTSFSENIDEKTVDELARFMPSEILINKEAAALARVPAVYFEKVGSHRRNLTGVGDRLRQSAFHGGSAF